MAVRLVQTAVAAAILLPSALGANLLVSHYTGSIYTLSYTMPKSNSSNGTLAITSSLAGSCGGMPSWLTLDSASGNLYCFDESASYFGPSPVVSSELVASNGSVTKTGQAKTSGGDVHGWLYGGSDGKSFVSMAE